MTSEVKELQDEIIDIQMECEGRIGVLRARIRAIQMKCNHIRIRATSCMGDSGTWCPDCGHTT